MAEFMKERIIEELKASTQNASGMFEISEETICALMSMLTNAAPQLPQPAVVSDIGEVRVGRLPTMNQDEYHGLGDWWVHLRIGNDAEEVLARVYGSTPQEANCRAEALASLAAMLHRFEAETDNTNQQFESLSRGNK